MDKFIPNCSFVKKNGSKNLTCSNKITENNIYCSEHILFFESIADELFKSLSLAGKIQFERAGNEKDSMINFFYSGDNTDNFSAKSDRRMKDGKPQLQFYDTSKDPYVGLRTNDKNSKFDVKTDGVYTPNIRAVKLNLITTIFYEVKDYNYIVICQHFPGLNGAKDVFYQVVIAKEFLVKKLVIAKINKAKVLFT